jgi:hypothetical protein
MIPEELIKHNRSAKIKNIYSYLINVHIIIYEDNSYRYNLMMNMPTETHVSFNEVKLTFITQGKNLISILNILRIVKSYLSFIFSRCLF